MRAVVLEAPGNLKLIDKQPLGAPGPGQARVRVHRVGVCGTDLHAYNGNQPMMAYPLILGHELAVEVLELGPETASSAARAGAAPTGAVLSGAARTGAALTGTAMPGDICTVIPYLSCGHCIACRQGKENACAQLEVLGVHRDGGLRDEFDLPADLLIPANDLAPDTLALVEMLAIGEHAVARAGIEADETVLVIGAGPIGLGAIAAARQRTKQVLAFDLSPERLTFLASLGMATPIETTDPSQLAAELRAANGGELPTVILDATGNAKSMSSAISLVAPGGRLVLVGHTKLVIGFDNPTLHRGELSVLASRNATRRDFDNVVANLRSGAIDVAPWITTRVTPQDLVDELPRWAAGPSEVVKAVVEFT